MIFITALTVNCFSQQASDYFPQQPGYKWDYRLTILDSLNNPVPEFNFYRADSFIYQAEYEGMDAFHILTKSGTEETLPFIPYNDTSFIHLEGSSGYEYYNTNELQFILSLLDSSTLNTLLPFVGLFESFRGWYLNYRFANSINQEYLIASIDRTVYYDSLEIPLRFILNGRRLADENLETALGSFLCKKFVLSRSVNYLLVFPPLPPIPIPIVTTYDTLWIAPGNWIVQSIIPSSNIDLTLAGFENYNIPGLKREIISGATAVEQEMQEYLSFSLEQNYPNPFNPSTKINFNIKSSGYVVLKVYNILGREVETLISKELNSGSYVVNFSGENFSSGVYYYRLNFSDESGNNYSETKQMLLLK